jgi:hypothetical protein
MDNARPAVTAPIIAPVVADAVPDDVIHVLNTKGSRSSLEKLKKGVLAVLCTKVFASTLSQESTFTDATKDIMLHRLMSWVSTLSS